MGLARFFPTDLSGPGGEARAAGVTAVAVLLATPTVPWSPTTY